jgi:hypothetical protein
LNRLVTAIAAAAAWLFVAESAAAESTPPFEIVKSHIEVEVQEGGGYLESREVVYRALTEQGAEALRQMTLSYTEGFQSYTVAAAYTLKKDGSRIDVDRRGMLGGYGASSSPGFQDLKTLTVVFPNVEVGDEVAITTVFSQMVPWFGKSYSEQFVYGREVPARDVNIVLTAPSDMSLQVDAIGVSEGRRESLGGKTRRVWQFENGVTAEPESNAVDDYDKGARLVVSTFGNYADFARVYAGMLEGRADVTPEIRTLADGITRGLTTDREQARALYEWVSLHIAYVNIVLGAGGFVPHRAAEVLANKYGDCKDHVILLQALLAAKGISSNPVLISADEQFTLSPAPSPTPFNHLITYVPGLHLYLDSTARYASFGVLPYSDSGKPVIHIGKGEIARTPVAGAAAASMRSVETVTIAPDGTIEGDTRVTATGAPAADLRSLVTSTKVAGDALYFQRMLGPGADGILSPGNADDLAPVYSYSAHYRQPGALSIPGPAAIPANVGYKPFSFTLMLAGDLPLARTQPYACESIDAEEDLTIRLPDKVQILAVPRNEALAAEDVSLTVVYARPDQKTVHVDIKARIDHAAGACTPAYYSRVHNTLAQMAAALRAQILYQ